MGVPTEAALDMESLHGPVSGDNVFDCGGQQMSIMWKASGKWRSVIEGVKLSALRELNLD